jgi:hypothetical protein
MFQVRPFLTFAPAEAGRTVARVGGSRHGTWHSDAAQPTVLFRICRVTR